LGTKAITDRIPATLEPLVPKAPTPDYVLDPSTGPLKPIQDRIPLEADTLTSVDSITGRIPISEARERAIMEAGTRVAEPVIPADIPTDPFAANPAVDPTVNPYTDPTAPGGPTEITPTPRTITDLDFETASQAATQDRGGLQGVLDTSLGFVRENPMLTAVGAVGLASLLQGDKAGKRKSSSKDGKPEAKPEFETHIPSSTYRPGIDPEFVFYRQSGYGFADGGPVTDPIEDLTQTQGMTPPRPNVSEATIEMLMQRAMMAIKGQTDNPDLDLEMLRMVIGDEAFDEFMDMFMPTEGGPSEGRGIPGIGGGVSDDVPAMIDGQHPAQLSSGEYVVPSDVVSHLGDGNTNAGIAALDNAIGQVRNIKTGNTSMPPSLGMV
jgi:hypothetical protein